MADHIVMSMCRHFEIEGEGKPGHPYTDLWAAYLYLTAPKIAWKAYEMVELGGLDDALVDAGVGAKIRERRKSLNISQTTLAEKIGVTFQQVQKYEKGTNRVSASKLHQIAGILGVELADLFANKSGSTNPANFSSESEITSFVRTPEGQRLNQAFANIADEQIKRRLIDLVKTIAA